MQKRIAVDIGGTFTDLCILDEATGRISIAKTPSTPSDPIVGAMKGVADANVDLKDVSLFAHGTTVATNALITRNLPPAAMICTRGFRDVIEIRRAVKEGRLQGRLAALYPTARPDGDQRARRLRRQRGHPAG